MITPDQIMLGIIVLELGYWLKRQYWKPRQKKPIPIPEHMKIRSDLHQHLRKIRTSKGLTHKQLKQLTGAYELDIVKAESGSAIDDKSATILHEWMLENIS